ncbi:hypothetical protein Tco_0496033 [Tanacetum coccineum]
MKEVWVCQDGVVINWCCAEGRDDYICWRVYLRNEHLEENLSEGSLAAEEAHSESTHSRAETTPRDAQGTPSQSAAQASISTAQGTADTQGTAQAQGTDEVQVQGVSVWEGAEEVQSIIHIKAEKCKNMKHSQDMQLIQKLRDDQKCMKKVFEVMSGRNIVTNSRVTPSWREIVSLTFSEAGVLHRTRLVIALSELDEPANYKQAMASLEAAKLKEAMKREIQSMYDNQVWNLVDTTPGLKTVGCEWIFKKKTDMDGKVHTYKARDRSKRLIGLSQDMYLDKILKRFKMENSKKGNLPLHHGIKISKDLCLKTNEELDRMSRVPYALAVRSIMYVRTCIRPDVSFALSMVFLLNGGAVTWKSSKQDTVADFTCESEYIAACEASKEAIWMKNFIGDLGVFPTVQDPVEIICDNESAVSLTKEPKDYEKSKHIERKYHFV